MEFVLYLLGIEVDWMRMYWWLLKRNEKVACWAWDHFLNSISRKEWWGSNPEVGFAWNCLIVALVLVVSLLHVFGLVHWYQNIVAWANWFLK